MVLITCDKCGVIVTVFKKLAEISEKYARELDEDCLCKECWLNYMKHIKLARSSINHTLRVLDEYRGIKR